MAEETSGEHRVMQAAAESGHLVTPASIASDLRSLGVEPGMLLNVHSAMSKLGFVVGSAQTAVDGLLQAVGAAGTLMMPSHSAQLSEPANWRNPPAPEEWWEQISDDSRASLSDPCVVVLSEYDFGNGKFRRFVDISKCKP